MRIPKMIEKIYLIKQNYIAGFTYINKAFAKAKTKRKSIFCSFDSPSNFRVL